MQMNCVCSIFIKDMESYLGVIGKHHNDKCLINIFTGEFLNGTQNIFTNSQYHFWFKELRKQFSPVLINTTHENIHFLNQVKGEIPICGIIEPKTLNKHD